MVTEVEGRSEFETWAEAELRRAGLFDQDADYGGMLGESVMKLVTAFAGEGHSGGSAMSAGAIFARLVDRRPLTPITSDPDEWMHIDVDMAGDAITWQSRRAASCFSKDGGRTYYDIDDQLSRWRRVAVWCNWRLPRRLRGTWRFHKRYRSQAS